MNKQRHVVAVIGGAVSGAQVAQRLAEGGAHVYVFEQNHRPFGKIEDGLPKWHSVLRKKEYERIKRSLSTEGVGFIPKTRIGKDIPFEAIVEDWGFSAIVLAVGAWRDRPLPVEGIEAYVNKGLIYQNPFIVSYNHADDPNFTRRRYPIEDGALVVGGGLASLDVVKLHMIELTKRKLAELGHETDTETLEKKGLPKVCEGFGVEWKSLGIKGATLMSRRGAKDLSLKAAPENPSPEELEKLGAMRERILQRALDKFCFNYLPFAVAEAPMVEGDQMVGLKVRKMKETEGGKLVATDELIEFSAPYVVSSIGSIPKPIPGVQMRGELLPFTNDSVARLEGYPQIFGAGNAVTGRGNIMASRKHAASIGENMVDAFLGLGDAPRELEGDLFKLADERMAREAGRITDLISAELPQATPEDQRKAAALAKARQEEVGYDGNLEAWVDALPPS